MPILAAVQQCVPILAVQQKFDSTDVVAGF